MLCCFITVIVIGFCCDWFALSSALQLSRREFFVLSLYSITPPYERVLSSRERGVFATAKWLSSVIAATNGCQLGLGTHTEV